MTVETSFRTGKDKSQPRRFSNLCGAGAGAINEFLMANANPVTLKISLSELRLRRLKNQSRGPTFNA
jgi:hypothetical protein